MGICLGFDSQKFYSSIPNDFAAIHSVYKRLLNLLVQQLHLS